MKAFLTVCSLIAVSGIAGTHEAENASPTPWGKIRSLSSRERSAELSNYLESLTTEEMLTAARQACREVEDDPEEHHDAPAWAAAEFHTIICLRHYFDKGNRNEGGAALLGIISDRSESHLLRRALISRLWNTKVPFDVEFQAYVRDNQANVTTLLTRILKDKTEPWLVRDGTMDYLAHQITTEIWKIIRSDPNAHAVWERTHTFVFVGKMLRSGELTLTEHTLEALKPLEERTIAYVKLLGAILADEESEPEEFRKQVKLRLEGYRRSALTGIDEKVEKALRETGE